MGVDYLCSGCDLHTFTDVFPLKWHGPVNHYLWLVKFFIKEQKRRATQESCFAHVFMKKWGGCDYILLSNGLATMAAMNQCRVSTRSVFSTDLCFVILSYTAYYVLLNIIELCILLRQVHVGKELTIFTIVTQTPAAFKESATSYTCSKR